MTDALAAIFQAMPSGVVPHKAAALDASFGFDITGDGGGQWTLNLKSGTCELLEGLHDPDVTLGATAADWLAIMDGSLDNMQAYMTGRLAIEGDLELADRLGDLFVS